MRLSKLALLALASLVAAAGVVAAADPVRISIAWIAAPANLAPILFAKDGIARHNGKTYTLQPVRFNGSPQMISSMGVGELDIALFSYSSFALAVENAGMEDLRIIADDFQGNVPGYFTEGYLVLRDSPIERIEDLRGKVLATNGVGGAIDIALRAALRRHNMEDKRDYTIVEAPLPSMKAMLIERKVDLIPAVIPFAHDPELKRASRMLFSQREVVGRSQTLLWAAKTGFLDKNRPAMVDFMEDVLRARRFYLDSTNHKEAVEIVAKFTKQPASLYEGWLFTNQDSYRDPDALPSIEALQTNINLQHELGFLRDPLNVQSYLDLSIVKQARSRLN